MILYRRFIHASSLRLTISYSHGSCCCLTERKRLLIYYNQTQLMIVEENVKYMQDVAQRRQYWYEYKTKAVNSKILPILKCILNRQRMIRGRNEIVQTSFHFRSIYDVQFCMSNKFINNVILKLYLVFNFSSKHDLVLWIHC